MRHFLDVIDTSGLPRAARDQIAGKAIPSLVNALESVNLTPMAGHSLDILAGIQRANAGRMKRLAEPCDPEHQPQANDDDTLVLVLTRNQEPVGCTAMRQKWVEDSLADAIEGDGYGGSLFFDDPRTRPVGQRLICTAPKALRIVSAPVAWSCGSFVQDGEEPAAFPAMIRLSFLWALARWRWQWLGGMCETRLANPEQRYWAFSTLGMTSAECGVSRVEPDRLTNYLLVTTHRTEFVRLAQLDAYADPGAPLGVPAQIRGEA